MAYVSAGGYYYRAVVRAGLAIGVLAGLFAEPDQSGSRNTGKYAAGVATYRVGILFAGSL